jgi:hypothetical protein
LDSDDFSHYLMPQNDRQAGRGSPPFDLVQLGMADSAPGDTNQNFALVGFWFGPIFVRKGSGILRERSKSAQEHGFHVFSFSIQERGLQPATAKRTKVRAPSSPF